MVDQKWIDLYPNLYGEGAHDPDEGKGDEELQDLVSQLSAKATGYGGTFSTWSERHSFLTGYSIGFEIEKIEPVPTPLFWLKESHYFKSGIACGYAAKCAVESARKTDWSRIGWAAGIGTALGTAIGPKILTLIGLS